MAVHPQNQEFGASASVPGASKPMLAATGISKHYGGHIALNNVDLEVAEGEFAALLGPSGCGKTTLLKLIGGLLDPTQGELQVAGRLMNSVPAHKRPVNTVFQNYALFPHMRVFENVAFGPRRQRLPEAEINEGVKSALHLVGMGEFAGRYPAQLSGGQQQRVALARAIVNKPSVLLLDEPLAALDLQLRKRMQLELKLLQRHLGMTFIFVTHDQDEALTMSDKIVVMNGGCIEQIGSGEDIYHRPATRFVAGFIGEANFIDLPAETIHGVAPAVRTSSLAQLMIRPEDIEVSLSRPSADAVQYIQGELVQKIFKGASVSCICRSPLGTTIIAAPRKGIPEISPGDQVYLSWDAGASRLFDI